MQRSLPLDPERLSGSSRVWSAARSLPSPPQEARGSELQHAPRQPFFTGWHHLRRATRRRPVRRRSVRNLARAACAHPAGRRGGGLGRGPGLPRNVLEATTPQAAVVLVALLGGTRRDVSSKLGTGRRLRRMPPLRPALWRRLGGTPLEQVGPWVHVPGGEVTSCSVQQGGTVMHCQTPSGTVRHCQAPSCTFRHCQAPTGTLSMPPLLGDDVGVQLLWVGARRHDLRTRRVARRSALVRPWLHPKACPSHRHSVNVRPRTVQPSSVTHGASASTEAGQSSASRPSDARGTAIPSAPQQPVCGRRAAVMIDA